MTRHEPAAHSQTGYYLVQLGAQYRTWADRDGAVAKAQQLSAEDDRPYTVKCRWTGQLWTFYPSDAGG